MSGRSRTVLCRQNVPMADFLCTKREEFFAEGNFKRAKTVENACNSLCDYPTPIYTAQEAKQLKHVGPYILKLLAHFFDGRHPAQTPQAASEEPLVATNVTGRNGKTKKNYCPSKGSAAYAILITLLRAHQSGKPFMKKQELIDETDKSGLSTKPIRPNAMSWTGGRPNSKDFYSGWNGMKTLTEKCLVAKSSNPAKYKLTEEGMKLAHECLDRSGLTQDNSPGHLIPRKEESRVCPAPQECDESGSGRQEPSSSDDDIQEIPRSDLRQTNSFHCSTSQAGMRVDGLNAASSKWNCLGNTSLQPPPVVRGAESSARADHMDFSRSKSAHYPMPATNVQGNATVEFGAVDPNFQLSVPPLEAGEKFSDVYEIIFVLDNREKYRTKVGTAAYTFLQRFAHSLSTQFKVKVETRSLPVGDAVWIARHKQHSEEYILDFVVERKNVGDLWLSIKDNRYKQQKLRMMNCGLKCLLYLVEGDVNTVESTESLKTAMFTTELQGGFRLLRTDDPNDTCKQYGHLTLAIISRYNMETGKGGKSGEVCKTYKDFVEHCKAFAKGRVKDVFCLQLTQISQVTEDIALSIQDRYPTLFSIAQAFLALEGNQVLQEKMLLGIPIRNTSKTISAVISKNIYKAIWAP